MRQARGDWHTGAGTLRGPFVGTRGGLRCRCCQCERSNERVHNPSLWARELPPHQAGPLPTPATTRALRPAAFGHTEVGTVRLGRRKFHGHARNATGLRRRRRSARFRTSGRSTRGRESAWKGEGHLFGARRGRRGREGIITSTQRLLDGGYCTGWVRPQQARPHIVVGAPLSRKVGCRSWRGEQSVFRGRAACTVRSHSAIYYLAG